MSNSSLRRRDLLYAIAAMFFVVDLMLIFSNQPGLPGRVIFSLSFALPRLTSDRRLMDRRRNHRASSAVLAAVGLVACCFIHRHAASFRRAAFGSGS